MRKIAEEVVRFNCRLPKPIADWLGAKAAKNGITLSEQVRHQLMDTKAAEDIIVETMQRKD